MNFSFWMFFTENKDKHKSNLQGKPFKLNTENMKIDYNFN